MRYSILKSTIAVAVLAAATAAGLFAWREAGSGPSENVAFAETLRPVSDTVRPGETLGTVLRRHAVDPEAIWAALRPLGVDSATLPTGTEVIVRASVDDSSVVEVGFRRERDEQLYLTRDGKDWKVERVPISWYSGQTIARGTFDAEYRLVIDSATSGPALSAANRDELIGRLADVFAWQVDFAREVSAGDQFRAVVELDLSNDGQQTIRKIRAVELTLDGNRIEAFWFQPLRGPAGYYDAEGRSLRRAFLRAPLEFRRISSTFAAARLHPILPVIRAHRGVDYAAPEGTPVAAAGAGMITVAGPSGQFGILVELDHGNGVMTRYGHLRRLGPGIRVGRAVTQGVLIGYVGQTGLATAPHLHYEFLVNGTARDLRWLDVDVGEPISPALVNTYVAERDQMRQLLRPSRLSVGTY